MRLENKPILLSQPSISRAICVSPACYFCLALLGRSLDAKKIGSLCLDATIARMQSQHTLARAKCNDDDDQEEGNSCLKKKKMREKCHPSQRERGKKEQPNKNLPYVK